MKILSNLTKWQNYVHYALLTFGIMLLLKNAWSIQLSFKQVALLYLFIFVLDTFVHLFFSMLPKPYKWED